MSITESYGHKVQVPQYDNIPRKVEQQHIIPRFFVDRKETDQIDPDTGLKVFRAVEYVELLIPGDKGNAPVKRVTDEHRRMYHQAYQQFKTSGESGDVVGDGIPLELWNGVKKEQAHGLKQIHIHTVQQLARLSDAHLAQPGMMGLRALRDKAQQFLEAARETAPIAALQHQLDALKAEAGLREKQLQDMIAKNTELEARVNAAGVPAAADPAPDLTTPRGGLKKEK